jgi:hypothetical protein
MSEYVFDFRRLEVYEAGAKLMTLLAFPEINDGGETWRRTHQELCALTLLARIIQRI